MDSRILHSQLSCSISSIVRRQNVRAVVSNRNWQCRFECCRVRQTHTSAHFADLEQHSALRPSRRRPRTTLKARSNADIFSSDADDDDVGETGEKFSQFADVFLQAGPPSIKRHLLLCHNLCSVKTGMWCAGFDEEDDDVDMALPLRGGSTDDAVATDALDLAADAEDDDIEDARVCFARMSYA